MRVNVNKCALVNFRGVGTGSLKGEPLPCAVTQRYLGLQVNKSLSWSDNCLARTRKAMRARFSLKPNLSTNNKLVVKIVAFTKYIVPMLAYGSQAWYPNITALKDSEEVQKLVMRWIFNPSTDDDYKNKWTKLELLPLSMCFEILDLLLLLKILDGDNDVSAENVMKITETKTTRQLFRNELKITETKHSKCNDKFLDVLQYCTTNSIVSLSHSNSRWTKLTVM